MCSKLAAAHHCVVSRLTAWHGQDQLTCQREAIGTCLTICCGCLSAGRRAPDRRGPSGDLGPLDPAIKVLEIESLGIKVNEGA